MTPLVDVQLLGTVQASVAGTALALRGPRQLRLVAALALEVSRVVSTDRLVDVIWPSGALNETSRTA